MCSHSGFGNQQSQHDGLELNVFDVLRTRFFLRRQGMHGDRNLLHVHILDLQLQVSRRNHLPSRIRELESGMRFWVRGTLQNVGCRLSKKYSLEATFAATAYEPFMSRQQRPCVSICK